MLKSMQQFKIKSQVNQITSALPHFSPGTSPELRILNKCEHTSAAGNIQPGHVFLGSRKLSHFPPGYCFHWSSPSLSLLAPEGGLIDFYANPR